MIVSPTRVLAALGLALALVGPASAAYDNTYSAGHADLGVAFDPTDGFFLHYHFGAGTVVNGVALVAEAEFDPSEVTTIVSDANQVTPGGTIPFLGNGPADPIWVLPANNVVGVPFFGFGTEELDPFDGWSSVTFAMTGFSGPGSFALWQNNSFGVPQVKWQTNNGINGSDSLVFPAGAHDHYFWGFTAPGIYDVTVRASASQNGTPYSDTAIFRFQVGNVVPEPSSMALVGLGLASSAVILARSRRRNGAANLDA